MPKYVMARPYGWPVSIDNITMVSPDIEIRLSDIKISPISAPSPEIYVTVKRATFRVRTNKYDATTSLDWRTLIESINNNAVFLPLTGEIEYLQWCLQECFEGRLSWNRTGTQVKTQFHIPDLNMSGSFSWLQNKSTITVTGYSGYLFLVEAEFVPEEKEINIEGRALFQANSRPLKLHGEAPFIYALEVSSLNVSLVGHLPLDGIVSASAIEQQLQAKITIDARPTWRVEIKDIHLSSGQSVSADVEIHDNALKARLTKPIDVKLETPFLEQATLTVASGAECAFGENISCTGPHASLTGLLDSYDVFTSFSAIQFSLDKRDWQLLTTVELDLASDDAPLVTAVLELTADNAGLHANARTVSLLGVSADKIEVNHNLKTGKGQVTVNVAQAATEFQSVIEYLRLQKLKFASGELSLEANFSWDLQSDRSSPVFDTTITATDLDVIYDDYQLRRGSFNMQLAGWPRIESTQPVSMSWQRLDIGVPLDDIQMSFDLELDPEENLFTLTGHTLDAQIFGGNISSRDYDYELTNSTGHLNLNLEKLELNQILALQEEDFESTGKISGSVPVHINNGKLNISEGRITAIEPGGFIKYKPSEAVVNLVAQNDQLKVVVDTMSDFQYHSLEAVLEYSPEGDLVARTALKGSNPAYENGREIHLNIKVEENLATLLKSLRLSDELTEKIGEKAKRGVH